MNISARYFQRDGREANPSLIKLYQKNHYSYLKKT